MKREKVGELCVCAARALKNRAINHPTPRLFSAHRIHPLAALAATLLLLIMYTPFLRLLARSVRNRRTMQATIAAARAATRAARAASSLDAALTGVWTKDAAASDSLDPALDLLAVGGLPRRAIALVRGIELRVDGDTFRMAAFSPIPLLKVREAYSLAGHPAVHRRRDRRGGGATGRTTRLPRGGGLRSVLTWNEPHAGRCVDVYRVIGDMLTVTSTVEAAGGSVTYKTVYRRKG